MLIGITGLIASGKSTVSAYLRERGYRVIDADAMVREELEDETVIAPLVERFGAGILAGKSINRKKLGKCIFENKEDRLFLNALIHPRVIAKIKQYAGIDDIIFIEVPLLYETGIEALFDKIIVVYADYQTVKERLMKRDNITEEYAIKKMNAQMDIEEKKKRADFVIDNRKGLDRTFRQLDTVLRRLI